MKYKQGDKDDDKIVWPAILGDLADMERAVSNLKPLSRQSALRTTLLQAYALAAVIGEKEI